MTERSPPKLGWSMPRDPRGTVDDVPRRPRSVARIASVRRLPSDELSGIRSVVPQVRTSIRAPSAATVARPTSAGRSRRPTSLRAVRQARAPRVLVVDDQPIMLRAVVRTLRRAGMQVYAAVDGVAACEVLQQTAVDVVLSDVAMPRMDGIALLAEMTNRYPEVPVILLTGGDDLAERLAEAGATPHAMLPKPVHGKELCARVLGAFDVARENARDLDAP